MSHLGLGTDQNAQEIRAISNLSCALFASTEDWKRRSIDALTVSALQDLTPERTIEKAANALYTRAIGDGVKASAAQVSDAFFRLAAEERFILSALHVGRWSYARIGRVLNLHARTVEQVAWAARLHLGSVTGALASGLHPAGTAGAGAECPEYQIARPWTQRFLDEELGSRERLFIQSHLVRCEGCRSALNRCRNFYYAVDRRIPRLPEQEERTHSSLLERVARQSQRFRRREQEWSFAKSLVIFTRRRDVQLVLAALGVLVFTQV